MDLSFIHLHNHSEYSILDGCLKVQDLVQAAYENNMPAVAMTDHGNIFGAVQFFKAAKSKGIKPILGCEVYVAPKSRLDRGGNANEETHYYHLVLLVKNEAGYRNLCRLVTDAYLNGFYYKPRIDKEILAGNTEGLIGLSACLKGEVNFLLARDQDERAEEAARAYAGLFAEGDFYLELQNHGLEAQLAINPKIIALARKLGLPLVATNDVHFMRREDAETQDVLLCIQTNRKISETDRLKFTGDAFYFKSPAEMIELFQDVPEAIRNTTRIASQCDFAFPSSGHFLPNFQPPEGKTLSEYFEEVAHEGFNRRMAEIRPKRAEGSNGHTDEEYLARLDREIRLIKEMGFEGYFLIVWDLIKAARERGLPVGPGRGSAAGSMVAYSLGITEIDPIEYDLLFERFLNPERISLPDIDMDFCARRRQEMIEYVTRKYGQENVSQIITFGTMAARAAIRDAGRVLEVPLPEVDRIAKLIPAVGPDSTLEAAIKAVPELRELRDKNTKIAQLLSIAQKLEGQVRNASIHAAGVVITPRPLIEFVPLYQSVKGEITTQFAMGDVEAIGLLKMDMLGLRNLTVIDDALHNIKRNRAIEVVLEDLPLDDTATFELLQRGDTLGVFQLDGGPMRALLRSMRPDKFEDISAVSALYRPGPMGADSHNKYARRKTGREPITPIHPELAEPLAEILDETYGLIVYQEQVMAIATKLAGYTLGAADVLRRVMGKKKKKELDAQYDRFRDGMLERGYSHEAFQTVWDILVPFSDYAFNKSHSAAYGLVSYQTAWLKANYPTEYMAALLQSVKDEKEKSAVYLAECRRMGIKVLPPDVNESEGMYTAVGTDIRFGLGAIRNVGANVVTAIVSAREEHGPATDFYSFLDNSPLAACNKRVIESLIKAGAFDSFGHSRRGLMDIFESAVDQVVELKRNAEHGQDSLLGGFGFEDEQAALPHDPVPEAEDWDKRTKLAFEREMLGLYVSDHPLNGLEHVLQTERTTTIAGLTERGESAQGGSQTICGMITQVQRRQTKQGRIWASLVVEDLDASINVSVFPNVYEQVAGELVPDSIVRVKGRVNVRDDSVELHADTVNGLDVTSAGNRPVVIEMKLNRCTPGVVDRLRGVLCAHPGPTQVRLRLHSPDQTTVFQLADELRVNPSQPLIADLKALLGPSCLGA